MTTVLLLVSFLFSAINFYMTMFKGKTELQIFCTITMVFGLIFICSQNTVDKLIKKTNVSLVVGTSSWREQFAEALTVSAGR